MILARRTGRFLFCLRSDESPSGGTWSPWGGKREWDETPRETALREVREETGLAFSGDLVHLYRMEGRAFYYDTFLMVVDDEFEPAARSEWQDYVWAALEDVPAPVHWGLDDLLSDRTAVSILVRSVERESGRPCAFAARPAAADS